MSSRTFFDQLVALEQRAIGKPLEIIYREMALDMCDKLDALATFDASERARITDEEELMSRCQRLIDCLRSGPSWRDGN
jgi:hypothetical protein